MKCLLVTAHPLPDSLCAHFATVVQGELETAGHEVVVEDLYTRAFDPVLSSAERRSYYGPQFDDACVQSEIERLLDAEVLIVVFPTWWFGFPAILKGWFDRVWAPGIAYDHANDFGPITPRLQRLRRVLAVTTLGSPWWVDRLLMGRPVRRVLKRAIIGTCAPRSRFHMLSFHDSERLGEEQVTRHVERLLRAVRKTVN